jgi:hypothetical protein
MTKDCVNITYSKYYGCGMILTFPDEASRDKLYDRLQKGENLSVSDSCTKGETEK